jgi:hypothetical protein
MPENQVSGKLFSLHQDVVVLGNTTFWAVDFIWKTQPISF